MNKNWVSRDEIIFGSSLPWMADGIDSDRRIGGGIALFEDLSLPKLQTLIQEDFIELDKCQNESPSTKEFMEFLEEFPEFRLIGYAVSPEREDYRVTITGLIFKGDVTKRMQDKFADFAGTASEYESESDRLYAWWD